MSRFTIVEGDEQRAFEQRPKAPENRQAERAAKATATPTGRKPLPGQLGAEEHEPRPESCGACGGQGLDVADELVERETPRRQGAQLRHVPLPTVRRAHPLRSLPAPSTQKLHSPCSLPMAVRSSVPCTAKKRRHKN